MMESRHIHQNFLELMVSFLEEWVFWNDKWSRFLVFQVFFSKAFCYLLFFDLF
jgi:hypothetical protein